MYYSEFKYVLYHVCLVVPSYSFVFHKNLTQSFKIFLLKITKEVYKQRNNAIHIYVYQKNQVNPLTRFHQIMPRLFPESRIRGKNKIVKLNHRSFSSQQ